MMNIGLEIKLHLKHEGRTQTWLSTRTGIPIHKLNLGLCGKRRITFDEYARICGALGVDTNCFLKPQPPKC